MKPAEVRKQIANAETAPLYLVEGTDLQSRLELAAEFASIVDEGLHAFNVQSFYGNEAATASGRDQLIASLLAAARTLPMMTPRRVLIVQQAERLLSPRKSTDDEAEAAPTVEAGKKRKRALTPLEELEHYLEIPEPLTTLVFVAGALDANRRLVKLVRKHAVAVDSGTIESSADAATWIRTRLERDSLAIEPAAIASLLETTHLDLGSIRAETEKLALYAAGEGTITAQHVRDLMLPDVEPGKGFPLGEFFRKGDTRAALREVQAQFDAGMQPFPILGQVRAAVRALAREDRIRSALDAVFRTDLAIKSSKSTHGEPRVLIECLVIELCRR